jgi:Uma2 family endonuclease
MLQSVAQQHLPRGTRLIVEVPSTRADWILPEEQVPESRPHDLVVDHVRALLVAWAARVARQMTVCRNLAVRWSRETPAIGVDPDVCVIEPSPPEGDALTSLRLWEPGHVPPLLAVEIVSPTRADKDYTQSPAKYAVNGTGELWVFDPELAGPKDGGSAYRIQVWRRNEDRDFQRVYAGEGPVWSEAVKGWLVAVDEGKGLGLADDEKGTRLWLTGEQQAQRRAELLAAKLRALGVDPDGIG